MYFCRPKSQKTIRNVIWKHFTEKFSLAESKKLSKISAPKILNFSFSVHQNLQSVKKQGGARTLGSWLTCFNFYSIDIYIQLYISQVSWHFRVKFPTILGNIPCTAVATI